MKNNNEAILFSKYISDFLYDYAPAHITQSEHTIKTYKNSLKLYISFLETKQISNLNLNRKCFEKQFIEDWLKWLNTNKKNSSATCNVRLGAIRTFLKYMGSRDISLMYLYNEAQTITRRKGIQRKVTGLSRNAVSTLLTIPNLYTKTGRRDYVFILLLYSVAGRIDEILSIKLEHLHLNQIKPYVTLFGKGNKIRTLFLLPAVVAHLKKYILEFHGDNPLPDNYLFYSKINENYNKLTEPAIDKRLKLYAKIANKTCPEVPLNLHAHQFRHAKASHWIEDGLNVVQVSFLLGHANLETTMVYLDISNEAKSKAMSTLENENETKLNKKWKNTNGTLLEFCNLA